MLCISRRIDGSIRIGPDILVTVLDIRGNQVRLGIAAPEDIRILRTEIVKGNKSLGGSSPQGLAPLISPEVELELLRKENKRLEEENKRLTGQTDEF